MQKRGVGIGGAEKVQGNTATVGQAVGRVQRSGGKESAGVAAGERCGEDGGRAEG